MIKVTKLDGREVVVNADLIEFLESTPETIISTTTGKKIVVKEKVEEVVRRIMDFRRRISSVVKPEVN